MGVAGHHISLSLSLQLKEIRGVVAAERADRQQLFAHLKSMQDAFLTSVYSLSSTTPPYFTTLVPLHCSPLPPSLLSSPLSLPQGLTLSLLSFSLAKRFEITSNQGGLHYSGLRIDSYGGGVCGRGRKHDDSAYSSSPELCKG